MSNDVQFFQTRMGRQFYEVTVPNLISEIHRLNDLLALGLELLERQAESPPAAHQHPRDTREG